MLKQYCLDCHSTKKQKGDLDLERFTSLDLVKRDPVVWEHSLDQIRDNEMPPKDKPKPSPQQRKLLTDWMQGTLDDIALASAGDPGPVVLRRHAARPAVRTTAGRGGRGGASGSFLWILYWLDF